MDIEQESEHRDESGKGLFDWLERRWEKLPLALRISSIPFLLIGLIATWFMVGPEFAQFLGYVIGGAFLLWQMSISSKRAKAAEETARAMQQTAGSTEKGNIAERFKNAIEHLGNESASVRLGGIYALHHIAQDVEEYRARAFEILCAHIRETTTQEGYKPQKTLIPETDFSAIYPSIEIQSILDLIFTRAPECEIYKKFRANLEHANLVGATLIRANLQNAFLLSINLEGAYLSNANLQGAFLDFSNLQGAWLGNTNLQGCSLQRANLSSANNLTIEQLLEVKTLYEAKLPDGMEEEIRRQRPELFEKP